MDILILPLFLLFLAGVGALWWGNYRHNQIDENARRDFLKFGFGGIATIIFSVIAIVNLPDEEADARRAKWRAEEAAETALRDKLDAEQAGKWNITVEQFRALKGESMMAHVVCQRKVREAATWTAENVDTGWAPPDFSWTALDKDRLRIEAQDVRMTNGFGGAREVAYSCVYDTGRKTVQIEHID